MEKEIHYSYVEIINKLQQDNFNLSKKEIRTIIIALRVLDAYDEALGEALDLYPRCNN